MFPSRAGRPSWWGSVSLSSGIEHEPIPGHGSPMPLLHGIPHLCSSHLPVSPAGKRVGARTAQLCRRRPSLPRVIEPWGRLGPRVALRETAAGLGGTGRGEGFPEPMTEEKPASVGEECFSSPQHPVVLSFLGDQSQFVNPAHIAPGTIVPARGKNPACFPFELVKASPTSIPPLLVLTCILAWRKSDPGQRKCDFFQMSDTRGWPPTHWHPPV